MDAICVFAAALAFYRITLAPTVIWGDSAFLAMEARRGSVRLATAGDHPLFVLVGHLFSKLPGEVARNINFEAAVFGALAVMLVYVCARQLGTSRLAATVGAAALCVSHTFWLHSVVAEVYTTNAFFVAATLTLLIAWRRTQHWKWLAASALVFAVGLTNHLVLATMAPAALAFIAVTKARALFTRSALVGVSGLAAVCLVLVIVQPEPVASTFRSFWYGPPGISEYLTLDFQPAATMREAGYYVLYLIYQFPSVSLLLGVVGALILLRDERPLATLLLLTVAVNAFGFIRHTVWPSAGNAKYVFYIADYVVFSILSAVGAHDVMRRLGDRPPFGRLVWASALVAGVALMPPVVYAIAPAAVTRAGVDVLHSRALPYRDNERFFLNPNKHGEVGARRFGEEALQLVKPSAVIFADYTPFTVLRYLQAVEGRRRDVLLASPRTVGATVRVRWIVDGDHRRPTYLAALTPGYYDFSGLTGDYDLVPAGPLIEIRPR